MPETEVLLHSRREGAKRLKIGQRTFDELLATKQIKSLKIGKRRMVTEHSLQEFVRRAERASR
jgi:excisionase family DNA binding protein